MVKKTFSAEAEVNIGEDIIGIIKEKLKSKGIDIDIDHLKDSDESRVKVVCVTPDLKKSVTELGKTPRGESLMVRIDENTRNDLDAWLETGYFKSRSEAAALFLKEGLKTRSDELAQLKDALENVQKAKSTLQDRAKSIFGE